MESGGGCRKRSIDGNWRHAVPVEGGMGDQIRTAASPTRPVRRLEGASPPEYDLHSRYFSIQLIHGGSFEENDGNMSYSSEHGIWFDQCDKETWSSSLVNDLIEGICYEKEGRMKVYYCVHGMQINTNELREINGDDATDNMISLVTFGHHFMDIYLDHHDYNMTYRLNDAIQPIVADSPVVISPRKQAKVGHSQMVGLETKEATIISESTGQKRKRNSTDKVLEGVDDEGSDESGVATYLEDEDGATYLEDEDGDSDFDPENGVATYLEDEDGDSDFDPENEDNDATDSEGDDD